MGKKRVRYRVRYHHYVNDDDDDDGDDDDDETHLANSPLYQ